MMRISSSPCGIWNGGLPIETVMDRISSKGRTPERWHTSADADTDAVKVGGGRSSLIWTRWSCFSLQGQRVRSTAAQVPCVVFLDAILVPGQPSSLGE